ncbi:hypothetical protein [Chitinimonas lacunae]|uniref:Big-1 domain-containing protein n=1 Tax=Chitinimonas lacunae TaxID=1963018 RepID=A0ABV8MSW3_9NEIS
MTKAAQFLHTLAGVRHWVVALSTVALVACGGPSSGTSDNTTPGPKKEELQIDMDRTTITPGTPATVSVVLRNEAGKPIANEVVTFSTVTGTYATFTPDSATALTGSDGVARIILNAGKTYGADTVVASARGATAKKSFQVGFDNLTVNDLRFGVPALSAYGTTNVQVTVKAGNAQLFSPVDVNFTSKCAAAGKATLSPKVTTIDGVATAQYKDNGCASDDEITVTVPGAGSITGVLKVQSASAGSIQFLSATPTRIALKGTGGAGLSETSEVKFRVVDTGGKPAKAEVEFSLSTSVGGLSLTAIRATSDPNTGEVSTIVNAGVVATPVRVRATVLNASTTLVSQSDQLSVSTGLPDQAHVSIAAETHNIEGWNVDGIESKLSIRLADHFSNPVPEGTVVNFVAEGASVDSTCTTDKNGYCEAVFRSQNLRPRDGRVTVLAYAIGEEAFTDKNGDGVLSPITQADGTVENYLEFVDANGSSTDLTEAYVDYNENGQRDPDEPFIDFNRDGNFNLGDKQYNGYLCKENFFLCSPRKSIHVRDMDVIVLSSSDALIGGPGVVDLFRCGVTVGIPVQITDVNGNPMPKGTTITFSVNGNGTAEGTTSYTVPDTITRPNGPNYFFKVKGDAPETNGVCGDDKTSSGTATITVTTPRGLKTTAEIRLIN